MSIIDKNTEVQQAKIKDLERQKQEENTVDWNMKQFDNYYQEIEMSVNTSITEIKKTLHTHPQIVSGELKFETELKLHTCQFRTNRFLTSSLLHLENENGIRGRNCNHIIVYIYKILKCLFNSSKQTQFKFNEIMLRLEKLAKENDELKGRIYALENRV